MRYRSACKTTETNLAAALRWVAVSLWELALGFSALNHFQDLGSWPTGEASELHCAGNCTICHTAPESRYTDLEQGRALAGGQKGVVEFHRTALALFATG